MSARGPGASGVSPKAGRTAGWGGGPGPKRFGGHEIGRSRRAERRTASAAAPGARPWRSATAGEVEGQARRGGGGRRGGAGAGAGAGPGALQPADPDGAQVAGREGSRRATAPAPPRAPLSRLSLQDVPELGWTRRRRATASLNSQTRASHSQPSPLGARVAGRRRGARRPQGALEPDAAATRATPGLAGARPALPHLIPHPCRTPRRSTWPPGARWRAHPCPSGRRGQRREPRGGSAAERPAGPVAGKLSSPGRRGSPRERRAAASLQLAAPGLPGSLDHI